MGADDFHKLSEMNAVVDRAKRTNTIPEYMISIHEIQLIINRMDRFERGEEEEEDEEDEEKEDKPKPDEHEIDMTEATEFAMKIMFVPQNSTIYNPFCGDGKALWAVPNKKLIHGVDTISERIARGQLTYPDGFFLVDNPVHHIGDISEKFDYFITDVTMADRHEELKEESVFRDSTGMVGSFELSFEIAAACLKSGGIATFFTPLHFEDIIEKDENSNLSEFIKENFVPVAVFNLESIIARSMVVVRRKNRGGSESSIRTKFRHKGSMSKEYFHRTVKTTQGIGVALSEFLTTYTSNGEYWGHNEVEKIMSYSQSRNSTEKVIIEKFDSNKFNLIRLFGTGTGYKSEDKVEINLSRDFGMRSMPKITLIPIGTIADLKLRNMREEYNGINFKDEKDFVINVLDDGLRNIALGKAKYDQWELLKLSREFDLEIIQTPQFKDVIVELVGFVDRQNAPFEQTVNEKGIDMDYETKQNWEQDWTTIHESDGITTKFDAVYNKFRQRLEKFSKEIRFNYKLYDPQNRRFNTYNLFGDLFGYQKEDVVRACMKNSVLLAHYQGTGKTIISISSAILRDVPRTLIVAPSKLVYNWIDEFDKFGLPLPHIIKYIEDIDGDPKQGVEGIGNHRFCIIPISRLWRKPSKIPVKEIKARAIRELERRKRKTMREVEAEIAIIEREEEDFDVNEDEEGEEEGEEEEVEEEKEETTKERVAVYTADPSRAIVTPIDDIGTIILDGEWTLMEKSIGSTPYAFVFRKTVGKNWGKISQFIEKNVPTYNDKETKKARKKNFWPFLFNGDPFPYLEGKHITFGNLVSRRGFVEAIKKELEGLEELDKAMKFDKVFNTLCNEYVKDTGKNKKLLYDDLKILDLVDSFKNDRDKIRRVVIGGEEDIPSPTSEWGRKTEVLEEPPPPPLENPGSSDWRNVLRRNPPKRDGRLTEEERMQNAANEEKELLEALNKNTLAKLVRDKFDAVIVDEAHLYSKRHTASSMSLKQLQEQTLPDGTKVGVKMWTLLTGTPIKNRVKGLFPIVEIGWGHSNIFNPYCWKKTSKISPPTWDESFVSYNEDTGVELPEVKEGAEGVLRHLMQSKWIRRLKFEPNVKHGHPKWIGSKGVPGFLPPNIIAPYGKSNTAPTPIEDKTLDADNYPNKGDYYIVGDSPTGSWEGHAGELATFMGKDLTREEQWTFRKDHGQYDTYIRTDDDHLDYMKAWYDLYYALRDGIQKYIKKDDEHSASAPTDEDGDSDEGEEMKGLRQIANGLKTALLTRLRIISASPQLAQKDDEKEFIEEIQYLKNWIKRVAIWKIKYDGGETQASELSKFLEPYAITAKTVKGKAESIGKQLSIIERWGYVRKFRKYDSDGYNEYFQLTQIGENVKLTLKQSMKMVPIEGKETVSGKQKMKRVVDKDKPEMPPKDIYGDKLPMTSLPSLKRIVAQLDEAHPQMVSEFHIRDKLENVRSWDKNKMTETQKIILADLKRRVDAGQTGFTVTNFTGISDFYKEKLKEIGVETATFDGRKSIEVRMEILRQFTEQKKFVMLLATYGAMDVGLNLPYVDFALFIDPQWDYSVMEQSWSRMLRPAAVGTKDVIIYRNRWTIDDYVWKLADMKKFAVDFILDRAEPREKPKWKSLSEALEQMRVDRDKRIKKQGKF